MDVVEILMGWGATALFLIVGGGGLVRAWRFARRARQATGMVAGQRKSTIGGGGGEAAPTTGYKPILQFTTEDGRDVRTTTRLSTSPSRFKPGEQVTVLYDARDPDEAVVKGCRGAGLLLTLLILFFLIGLGFLAVTLIATFR